MLADGHRAKMLMPKPLEELDAASVSGMPRLDENSEVHHADVVPGEEQEGCR